MELLPPFATQIGEEKQQPPPSKQSIISVAGSASSPEGSRLPPLLAVKTTGRERKRKGDGAHDGWTEEAENEKGKGGGPWWSPIDINRERERAVYVYVGVYM
nr:hypothetical protein Iba_chr07aCG6440 [Ipomoea batatas]